MKIVKLKFKNDDSTIVYIQINKDNNVVWVLGSGDIRVWGCLV